MVDNKLDSNYWDCECKENYIHGKFQTLCTKCDTLKDESPDSIISEILKVYFTKGSMVLVEETPNVMKSGVIMDADVNNQTLEVDFDGEVKMVHYSKCSLQ